MYIDFNQIARIGKIVALLGFFLPWVTVSCSDTQLLTATGWQLMTGDPQPAGPLVGAENQNRAEDAEPAIIIIAAFAVILIGLAISVFTRAKIAAAAMLTAAVLGIGISYYGVENMRGELRREISNQPDPRTLASNTPSQDTHISDLVAAEITVKEEEGYMVTHGGLLLAAIFSLLTLFRRQKPEADSAASP